MLFSTTRFLNEEKFIKKTKTLNFQSKVLYFARYKVNCFIGCLMKKNPVNAVLPVGASDVLAPFAQMEANVQNTVMDLFSSCGYQRIAPSFLEFEETLLADNDGGLSLQTLRFCDFVSGKMMGVRADMTMQAARIAATRLKDLPRPLRVAYTGTVLRGTCDGLRPRRQVLQTGAELTGTDCAAADAEIILLAHEALKRVLNRPVSLDLTLPTLFKALCRAYGVAHEEAKELQEFLNQKDFYAVKERLSAMGKKVRDKLSVFESLFDACGEISRVLSVLNGVDLPSEARAECRRLSEVADILAHEAPDAFITADVLENRGFEYHCGLSFSFFDKISGRELARGGRYLAGVPYNCSQAATGVTLMTDAVVELLSQPPEKEKVYVPKGTPFALAMRLIQEGHTVVFGLGDDWRQEAQVQDCAYAYIDEQLQKIKK